MKILESRSYCTICRDPLELNNIGAVIIGGQPQNACQDPCVSDYNEKHNPIDPKDFYENRNILEGLEQALPIVPAPPTPPPFQDQQPLVNTPDHQETYQYSNVIIENDMMTILTASVTPDYPFEIFFETMLAEYNITKFVILKVRLINEYSIPVRVSLKSNAEQVIYVSYYLDEFNSTILNLWHPIFIANNDLVLEFTTAKEEIDFVGNLSVSTEIYAKIIERST